VVELRKVLLKFLHPGDFATATATPDVNRDQPLKQGHPLVLLDFFQEILNARLCAAPRSLELLTNDVKLFREG
jgi:hypothetical protein